MVTTPAWRSALALLISLGMVHSAYAVGSNGIGNEVLSARSLGQGAVGIAGQNNDPVSVYSNPAAMTKLSGTQMTAGFTWENLHGNYESPSGHKVKMRSEDVFVPNFAVTHRTMDDRLGLGLGVFSPYGLETHWPGDSSLRYVATNSKLRMVIITPAVAYKVSPQFSIGAGLDYLNAFDNNLEKHVNVDFVNAFLGAPTSGSPDAISDLGGQGSNWGFHTGAMYELSDKHAFGLTYHSKMKLRLNGNIALSNMSGTMAGVFGGSRYETSTYGDLFLPQNVQMGYAWKPTEAWHLEFNTAWYNWSSNKDLNIRYAESDPTRLALLNVGNPIPHNWRDCWSFATGVNYKYSVKTELRTGFWYLPHATPDSTFTPALMDLDRYSLTLGTGHHLTEAFTLDLAYNAIFFKNRSVTNTMGTSSTGNPGVDISGTYKNFVNLVSINGTFRF